MSGDTGNDPLIAGRYRLLGALGQGGMGVVWLARDELLGREVAVKEVRAPRGLDESEVQRLYTRLEREGWAAARVSHRNVVTVYDVATHDGRPWIVMELVRGVSLADALEAAAEGEGPMPPARAARIGAEVLAALRAAHEAGVLHRDVKPGNILLANDGRVVLTDFGIAVIEGGSALTMTGEVIGSPEFLAPERALGRNPGPPSDLWSLGVTLYAAVEGASPFRRDTALSTLRAVVDEELPPPVRAGALAGVIEGLLRKDPAERMGAAEAERDLRLVAAGGRPTGTRPLPPGGYVPTTVGEQSGGSPPYAAHGAVSGGTQGFGPATDPGTGGAPAGRGRRAGAVLAAGVLALALGAGGLAYALLGDGDGNGSSGQTSGGSTDDGGGKTTGGTGDPTDTPTDAPTEKPTHGPTTRSATTASPPAPPALAVTLTVSAARADYSGPCPPPEGSAPSFYGVIKVNRAPAELSYRWVTRTGKGDSDWKDAHFPSGQYSIQVDHVITAYTEGGAYEDVVALQVKSPEETSSGVSFTTLCTTESPSPSPS
ncbi:serine/threonine-protein kinase [Streptomyces polyrhachis]|uniref:non-specific serine/threonine protein kinase n=1 Tax=Streptomyces polyrhachis TaxID=1282885 RepID=A0ABW2GGV5_9ACTN